MVDATLEHTSTAYIHQQQTRTHHPIEKAPKIITLIWFSGSNLILSLSFTSHFYFLSIFPPHLHRRWQGDELVASFSIHSLCLFFVCMALSLPAYCVAACCWQVSERQSVCVYPHCVYTPKSSQWNSSSSWKWLDIHIHIIKIKSIVQSMMGIERKKKSAKGNSKRDIVSEKGSEKKTPNPQYM